MFFIGDVHGEWNTYRYFINKMQLKGDRQGMDSSLVVGDMGLGFSDSSDDSVGGRSFIQGIPLQHKFIVGNHDNRKLSHAHPNCLGDYGYHEKSGIFYVSGGFSFDYQYRTKDESWWEDEELSKIQMAEALELYRKVKPSILVSHEAPAEVKYFAITNSIKKEFVTRTETLLQEMIEAHRPDHCIFGHHHNRMEMNIGGTEHVCLGSMSYGNYADCILEIPEIKWE